MRALPYILIASSISYLLFALSPAQSQGFNRYDEWFERHPVGKPYPREHSEGYRERSSEGKTQRNLPASPELPTRRLTCRKSPNTQTIICK